MSPAGNSDSHQSLIGCMSFTKYEETFFSIPIETLKVYKPVCGTIALGSGGFQINNKYKYKNNIDK